MGEAIRPLLAASSPYQPHSSLAMVQAALGLYSGEDTRRSVTDHSPLFDVLPLVVRQPPEAFSVDEELLTSQLNK